MKESQVITQCSMRHLYAASKEPGMAAVIDQAKTYERRRCNHLPEDYPEPLSTKECLSSVVDPKGNKTNKHRYVVASQELEVRKLMRGVMGVPLVYINRSVMIMEPMAGATAENREREERQKFRDGLKGGRGSGSLKRKREEDEAGEKGAEGETTGEPKKTKKRKGPKGPNPLSVKKPKKRPEAEKPKATEKGEDKKTESKVEASGQQAGEGSEPNAKPKRRRKHKSSAAKTGVSTDATDAAGEDDGDD